MGLKMVCLARKGIPKFHAKFNPTATSRYQYQAIVNLNRSDVDGLTLDEKVEFIQACPRKVFGLDDLDKLQVVDLDNCIYCDECDAKAKEWGKPKMVEVKQQLDKFHFTVEGIGTRSAIDIVRAAI